MSNIKTFFKGFFDDFGAKLFIGCFTLLAVLFLLYIIVMAFMSGFIIALSVTLVLLAGSIIGHFVVKKIN